MKPSSSRQPVAAQESFQESAVTVEGAEVQGPELMERAGDHRAAPIDDSDQGVCRYEEVVIGEVAVPGASAIDSPP